MPLFDDAVSASFTCWSPEAPSLVFFLGTWFQSVDVQLREPIVNPIHQQ